MPTIRQLEYLVAIADLRHFRRAAEKVNTTQPTLSGQLKALEDRLGVILVERSRARVALTPVGVQVVEIARRMLQDAREIRAIGSAHQKRLSGIIRLGLPQSIGPSLIPLLVRDIKREYPDLKFYPREEEPQLLPDALANGTFDVVIAPLPLRGGEFSSMELYKEPIYVAVAADHQFAGRGEISRSDLAGVNLLALGEGHPLHAMTRQLAEECGARLLSDYVGTSLDALREMVATGLGAALIPGLYAKTQLSRDRTLRLLTVTGKPMQRTVGVAWRKASARHSRFAELASLMRSIVAKTVLSL